ncbi:hypothetical protein PIIN_11072 [Serendipita indica DSM 11827]|uniref:Uncharacterized protein n=1 Tax=Serendipita indica (strain DSM 11827) TaxID=1109443 RepID=G4U0J4_SERID|nr:hypothetical protein PIIN_11072 [Serendipita indica DSM 11827]
MHQLLRAPRIDRSSMPGQPAASKRPDSTGINETPTVAQRSRGQRRTRATLDDLSNADNSTNTDTMDI